MRTNTALRIICTADLKGDMQRKLFSTRTHVNSQHTQTAENAVMSIV